MSAQKHKLISINNLPDHLHLLVGLRPDAALSDLVRDIKASSSHFINQRRWVMGRFSWQEGFGAFSYSRSQLGEVIRYSKTNKSTMPRNPFWMNTVLCCRNTTSNTTRFTSSNPLMDNFPMMPPLTGLGIGRIVIFYIYAAPTALLAEILRLRNVQTPDSGCNPESPAEAR